MLLIRSFRKCSSQIVNLLGLGPARRGHRPLVSHSLIYEVMQAAASRSVCLLRGLGGRCCSLLLFGLIEWSTSNEGGLLDTMDSLEPGTPPTVWRPGPQRGNIDQHRPSHLGEEREAKQSRVCNTAASSSLEPLGVRYSMLGRPLWAAQSFPGSRPVQAPPTFRPPSRRGVPDAEPAKTRSVHQAPGRAQPVGSHLEPVAHSLDVRV